MLYGINEIEFYESQEAQRFSDFETTEQVIKYEVNTIPSFILISDTSEAIGTVQVFDVDGNSVGSAENITISDNSDATQLLFSGTTISGGECGFYYLKITLGADIYYSEYFQWVETSDLSNYFKINLSSIGNSIINNKYTIDTSLISYVGYYSVPESEGSVFGIETNVDEEGIDKNYGVEPINSTISYSYNVELNVTEGAYKFLSQLRHFEINGTIYTSYKNNLKECFNFEVEVNENTNYGESLIVTLKFKEKIYMSNSNE